MIAVTRLDGTPLIVNGDQISWIEHNPDTVIVLSSGERLIVREAPDLLVERVKDFKRATLAGLPGTTAGTIVEAGVTGTVLAMADAARTRAW